MAGLGIGDCGCGCSDIPPPVVCNLIISGSATRCGIGDGDYSGITVTLTATPVSPATTAYDDQETTTDASGYYVFDNPITADNYDEYADVTITASYPGFDDQSVTVRVGCTGVMVDHGAGVPAIVLNPDSEHCCVCNCLMKRTYHATSSKGSCELVWDGHFAWNGEITWTESEGAVIQVFDADGEPGGFDQCRCPVKQTVTAHAFYTMGFAGGGGFDHSQCNPDMMAISMTSAFSTLPNQRVYPDCWTVYGDSICREHDPDHWRNEPRFLDQAGGFSTTASEGIDCGSPLNSTFTFSPTGWPPETATTVTVTE